MNMLLFSRKNDIYGKQNPKMHSPQYTQEIGRGITLNSTSLSHRSIKIYIQDGFTALDS